MRLGDSSYLLGQDWVDGVFDLSNSVKVPAEL